MELYEYLIGGKKTGRIDDLKDPMTGSKSFRDLKTGETFFVSQFKLDGTCTYTDEIKISSIDKKPTHWLFIGFTKKGIKYTQFMWMGDLDKKLDVGGRHTRYKVCSTFKMDDDKTFFELVKKEVEN